MNIQENKILVILLLIGFINAVNLNKVKCYQNLNTYIEKKLKPHQVVLLADSNFDPIVKHLIPKLLKNLPYTQIDVKKIAKENLEKFTKSPLFGILRKTNLFLLVNSYTNGISLSLKYLMSLSPGKVRPQVLLISVVAEKSVSTKSFLKKMWLNKFLDFTILEVINPIEESLSMEMLLPKLFVHWYSPFGDHYDREKCCSRTIWFGDKLKDLYGHPIVGGLALRPPYSLVEYDKSGRLINQHGADVVAFNALAKAMNFSAIIDSNENSSVGVFRGRKATGMLGKLIENKINLLITSVLNFRPNADGALYGYSSNINMERFVAVVPIVHTRNEEKILNLKIMFLGVALFVCFVFLIWNCLRRVSDERDFWQLYNITAILLGFTIVEKPKVLFNRLVFIYLTFIGICFSSNFHAGLTAGHVKETEEIKYHSLKDLGNSNLIPMIHPNFFNLCLDNSVELKSLKEKTISTELIDTVCPEMLFRYKNVTCLLMNAYARRLILAMRDSLGLPIAKILDNSLFTARRTLALEKNSPYKERIDKIITSFTESGLRQKWSNGIADHEFSFNSSKIKGQKIVNVNDFGAVSNLIVILCLLTLPGYLLSISVFIGEIYRNQLMQNLKHIRRKLFK